MGTGEFDGRPGRDLRVPPALLSVLAESITAHEMQGLGPRTHRAEVSVGAC